jgi:hypothetical protein
MQLGYEDVPARVAALTAEEQVTVPSGTIAELARATVVINPNGPADSVLLFHASTLHSSAHHVSPLRRTN